ncbi:MAG: bifunctional DNA-formamidopyrimidine glycosylase/DNA-(apurinic or apyrimidinic site) lyase [Pirellulales bacterium]|nr:bifunctional DNA-formamidopyrimidine glycosylase/DNA-(apurinic or apyrimidinic site) lyase [Pirellulales bacterium]
MPELPEVETMRRGVLPVVGHRIAAVVRPPCRLRPIAVRPSWATLRQRAAGQTIERVDRVGKRVVLVLSDSGRIVIEPRMTGLVLLAEPPNREHLRLALQLEGGPVGELLFWDRRGLGTVRWTDARRFATLYGPEKLGPDALEITAEQFRARLAAGRRPIKVALLDQRAVCGIGNLYAAEILHVAGIDPRRKCHGLSRDEWDRVAAATREILAEAIRYEGSTLADGTYRNALNKAGGYQNHHRVYDRAGQPCRRCGATILRIVQAQRSTFFCPDCQPRGRRRTAPIAPRPVGTQTK